MGRFLGISFEWFFVLIIFLFFAVRSTPFQNFLADTATSYLSMELDTKVSIDQIDLVFFDRADIEGVYIEDRNGDTLVFINSLDAKIGKFNIAKKFFYLDHVNIKDPTFNLVKYKGDTTLNLQFIVDYFKKDEPDTSKNDFDFKVDEVSITNGAFKFWDENVELREKGMDFKHLDLKDLNLNVVKFKLQGDNIAASIQKLAVTERSGFILNNLQSKVKFSSKGVELQYVTIRTPFSHVSSDKLDMLTTSFKDYGDYINKVEYHSDLNYSIVSLQDVAYFAPILWGSNEKIKINSKVDGVITQMKFRGLELEIGERTKISADFDMPKFTQMDSSILNADLKLLVTDFDDLENIKMPDKWADTPLQFSDQIKRIGKLNLTNVSIQGDVQEFTLKAEKIKTSIGEVDLKNGLVFTYDDTEKMYVFGKDPGASSEIFVKDFDLGKFLANDKLGKISGKLVVSGKGLDPKNLNIDIGGKIDKFQFNNYDYKNITIKEGKLTSKSFKGKLDIKDENLDLTYAGEIDFSSKQLANFNAKVNLADLSALGFLDKENTQLSFKTSINVKKFDPDKLNGRIAFYNILLKSEEKEFVSDSVVIDIKRGVKKDFLDLKSDLFEGQLEGKLYTKTFLNTMMHEIQSVFPSYTDNGNVKKVKEESDFKYHLLLSDKINDLFDVFVPTLELSSNTKLIGNYHGDKNEFDLFILADQVDFKGIQFKNIDFYNQIGDSALFIDNQIGTIQINDSLSFENIMLSSNGKKDVLKSILKWGSLGNLKTHPAILHFDTEIIDNNNYELDMGNSFFYLKENKWDVSDQSKIYLNDNVFKFENVKFSHKDQYIGVNGLLSDQIEHKSDVSIHDFELSDINDLFGGALEINGILNGKATIASPTKDMFLAGNFLAKDLMIDKYLLGDMKINQGWENDLNKFVLTGNLVKEGIERFNFNGNYFLKKKKDPLDVKLNFDYTDISFVNAVLPTDAIQNIRGMLLGSVRAHGEFSDLTLDGDIDLYGGNVKVEMLGVNFGLSGKIHCDKYGFTLNKMPLIDEEGNAGYLYGAVFHENFKDWNFEADINLEEDYFSMIPNDPWQRHKPLDKFLLMNSTYSEGASFYGKAYGTGMVNVFGHGSNMEFNVGIRTEEGTDFYLPIFSSGDLEKDDFIVFLDKDSLNSQLEEELDLSGISLNLGFEVNENAKVNLLLDEYGDNKLEKVTGNGYIEIGLDQLNDLSMTGDYLITSGEAKLGFASIVNKKIDLKEGGVVSWSGNPYNAMLDAHAVYTTNSNIYDASPSLKEELGKNSNTTVNCIIKLEESLMEPKIRFGIQAPEADDGAKDILARIEADTDELNKQFFSLLLLNKFQPMSGESGASGSTGAVGDLVASKINELLDDVSNDFKLGVGINSEDDMSAGDYTINGEFALDPKKRLTLKTSFGYSNSLVGDHHVSSLIGDVVLEYKLNKQGSFRVNVFNESNDSQTIQDKKIGNFTQGAGLFYTESFSSAKDFKLLQHFLNIFRSKENKRKDLNPSKENRKTDIPENKKHLLEDFKKKKNRKN